MASEENPVEEFRRVTAATMRAISEREDIQLTFGSEARLVGNNARLPAPPKEMGEEDIAHLRGEADAMALKLKFHDEALHRSRAPAAPDARAVFETLEQVRVEALGSQQYKGVAGNLGAAFQERCKQAGYARVGDREEVNIADVVGMLSREKLLGVVLPVSAENALGYWRDYLQHRIGPDFDQLATLVDDQEAFAKALDHVLVHLDLLDLENEDGDEEISEESPEEQDSDESDDEGETSETSESMEGDEDESDQDEEDGPEQMDDDAMAGED